MPRRDGRLDLPRRRAEVRHEDQHLHSRYAVDQRVVSLLYHYRAIPEALQQVVLPERPAAIEGRLIDAQCLLDHLGLADSVLEAVSFDVVLELEIRVVL